MTNLSSPSSPAAGREPLSDASDLSHLREWISRAAQVCERAADGDLEPRLLHAPERGDLGRMLRSINHLLDITDAFVREAGAALDHGARGKFFRRVVVRGMPGSFRHACRLINTAMEEMARQSAALRDSEVRRTALAQELDRILQTLESSAMRLKDLAGSLATQAGQTTQDAGTVAFAVEQTSASVQTVAAATEELTAAVTEVEQQTKRSANFAQEAVRDAEQANEILNGLLDGSRRVGGVVKLISQIAGQTNLLALNATIEAARSGEAGRGFAVVATEVKNLARRTASATEEITSQVESIQQTTGKTAEAVSSISERIRQAHDMSNSVADSINQQRLATSEISQSVQRVAASTRDVSGSIRAVSAAAGDTSQCANQILSAADELSRQSDSLRAALDSLLAGLQK